jgi:4-diphosphocytidyl-2-C-methyl-D-erythritol kinase
MICFPNAKINIGLNIVEKRNDCFHNIESVFYPVNWKDALEVIDNKSFKLETSGLEIEGNATNNLVYKAFELLKPFIYEDSKPHFHLHKVIPMGAGLGGGSADGAFALKLLNDFYRLELNNDKLESLAAQLGSDCPFFIENKPVFSYDRGIKFKTIDLDLSLYYIVLVNPNIHIGTAEAYGLISPKKPSVSLIESIKSPIENWKDTIVNDFEAPLMLKYPKMASIKKELYQKGALYASMTGSGSTLYGIFKEEVNNNLSFANCTVWQGKLE